MQNKQLRKKLTLKKRTISNLDNKQLGAIQAGVLKSFDNTICKNSCISNCHSGCIC